MLAPEVWTCAVGKGKVFTWLLWGRLGQFHMFLGSWSLVCCRPDAGGTSWEVPVWLLSVTNVNNYIWESLWKKAEQINIAPKQLPLDTSWQCWQMIPLMRPFWLARPVGKAELLGGGTFLLLANAPYSSC